MSKVDKNVPNKVPGSTQLGVLTRYANTFEEKCIKKDSAVVGGWRLRIEVQENRLSEWKSQEIFSSKSFEETYDTEGEAKSALPSFIAWAEKGAAYRKKNPFVRSVKRGAVASSSEAAADACTIVTPASSVIVLGVIPSCIDEVKAGETVGGNGSPTEPTKMRRSSRPKRQAHELSGEGATPPAKSENLQRKRGSKRIFEPRRGSVPALDPCSLFQQSDFCAEKFEPFISPHEFEKEKHLFE